MPPLEKQCGRRSVVVLTTYLELVSSDLNPEYASLPGLIIRETRSPSPAFYRALFDDVGSEYFWDDRLDWTDHEIIEHFGRPDVMLLVLELNGKAVGYAELVGSDREIGAEITHFGLISEAQGRGLGKHLLSCAAERAFAQGAARIWLHTDNFDSPYAVLNYLKRGFRPFRRTISQDTIVAR